MAVVKLGISRDRAGDLSLEVFDGTFVFSAPIPLADGICLCEEADFLRVAALFFLLRLREIFGFHVRFVLAVSA